MVNIGRTEPIPEREIAYFRQRQKNSVLNHIATFFAEEAERNGITRKLIADKLQKDPSQITRWLSAPGNVTLDTISDILLALDAEMEHRVVRFRDKPSANYEHPLLQSLRAASNIHPTVQPAPPSNLGRMEQLEQSANTNAGTDAEIAGTNKLEMAQ